MSKLRGLLAMVLFIPGFILIAAGVSWVIISLNGSALVQPMPPLGTVLLGMLPGCVVGVVGVGLLFASRAMDGTRGLVRRYGKVRRKRARV